jgi:hypothetical protein
VKTNTKQWCGPSALSIITGRPYADAVREIEEITGRRFRVIVEWDVLLKVLRAWDFKVEGWRLSSRQSVRTIANEYRSKLLLVRVGNHFIVLLDGEYYDQHHIDGAPVNTIRKMVSHVAVIP